MVDTCGYPVNNPVFSIVYNQCLAIHISVTNSTRFRDSMEKYLIIPGLIYYLYTVFSTPIIRKLPLVVHGFSPYSTAPITTTTIYIKKGSI